MGALGAVRHGRSEIVATFDDVTEHEHNLTWCEIETATRAFTRTDTFPFHLVYRLKRFIPAPLLDVTRRFDFGALAVAPVLRRIAGAVVIRVVK